MASPQYLFTPQRLQQYRQSAVFRRNFPDYSDSGFDRVLRYGFPVGSRIEIHDRLPRCMSRLRELITASGLSRAPLPSGTVIVARELDSSCGRFEREWFAHRGGLWLAMAWADTLLPDYARMLPLAAGSASCQAIRSFGVDAALKWVNDIHVNGCKIGGILCETFTGGSAGDSYQLIGIGINGNNIDFPRALRPNATSMKVVLGTSVDLEEFTVRLLGFLTWHVGLVHLHEEQELNRGKKGEIARNINPVVDAWRKLSDTPGRDVIYGFDVVRHPQYRATAVDIDSSGGLVLRLPDGRKMTEYSGEILYLPTKETSPGTAADLDE